MKYVRSFITSLKFVVIRQTNMNTDKIKGVYTAGKEKDHHAKEL